MLVSVSFMGTNLELDDGLMYYAPMDYWVKLDEGEREIIFGLTPAASLKEGGYRAVEFTVQEGDQIKAGEVVAVAVTAKIKYLETPAGGIIVELNRLFEHHIAACFKQAGTGWLARIRMDDLKEMLPSLLDLSRYIESLRAYEGQCAPPGIKAAGSPTCRSVYDSIRKQKET